MNYYNSFLTALAFLISLTLKPLRVIFITDKSVPGTLLVKPITGIVSLKKHL